MDCLVTKLKGVVNDDSLYKLGEFRLKKERCEDWDAASQCFLVQFEKDEVLTIVGDGYFTDATGINNEGKIKNVSANTETKVYVSNGDFEIAIPDKYNLNILTLNDGNVGSSKYASSKKIVGGIRSLSYSGKLHNFTLNAIQELGDISELHGLNSIQYMYGNYSSVSGDIASLKDYTNLVDISFPGAYGIYGNVDSLSKLVNLSMLNLEGNMQMTGDISVFKSMPNLMRVNLGASTLEGDYFDLLASKNFSSLLFSGDFTYVSKNFSGKQYGNVGGDQFICEQLDEFLNDFQQASTLSGSGRITMLGTRTSASDAAISTLQGKGFTVTVPAATDAASVMTMAARVDAENFGIAYKDGQLVVGPVDLSKQKIYPAAGVTVETFATKEEAERFIKDKGLNTERNIFWPNI